jgi:DNA-binding MarR family transcriptional regulator
MPVDQSQRIGFLLYRIGRAIATEYRREMDLFGFRPEVARMLHALHDRGPTHTRELSRTIGVNRQTIVNEANVLTERGLITRSASATDSRLVVLAITDRGRRELARMDQQSQRFDERLNTLFAPKELETLRGQLARIAASDAIGGQPLLAPDPPKRKTPRHAASRRGRS